MKKVKYNEKLYYISEKKLDNNTIYPKIPNNYLTQNAYEDNKTKRVCLCKSIDKCLMALSKNCSNLIFNVYIVDDINNYEVFEPDINEVPDSKITGELWILTDVKVNYIGKIKCISSILNDGYEYSYGTNVAYVYDWKYKWIKEKKIKLNNGIEIPQIGLGTFMISPKDAEISVREALKMGYRLIDTANAYVNERAVGRGIKSSLVDRKDVFLSTKLWASEYENENAVDETLERLGVEYIDLLFIHQPSGNYLKGYKQLEKAYKEGKIKAIGISNFEGDFLSSILEKCEIKPQVLQVERHPYYTGKNIQPILDKENIKVMSWYPLGHGDASLMNEPIFKELGEKYGKSPAQIIMRWHIQKGFIVIPGSKNVDHIKDNLNIFDFELTDKEMNNIALLDTEIRYYNQTDSQLESYASWQPEYEVE